MTIAHKNLTGTDLHEIKGASTATAGQVPIADGAGGAPFGKIGSSSLGPTANPFGAALFQCVEQQASGTSSVMTQATSWTTQLYTHIYTNEITGASQSGGSISLPSGLYYLDAYGTYKAQSFNGVSIQAQARLYNQTTSSVALAGTTQLATYSVNTGAVVIQNQIQVTGRFFLGTPTAVALQLYVASQGNFPATSLIGAGGNTLYTNVRIWKVG